MTKSHVFSRYLRGCLLNVRMNQSLLVFNSLGICGKWSHILLNVSEFVSYFHMIRMKLFIFCQGYHRNYIAFLVPHMKE